MDIVEKLRLAVAELPDGDYSPGLTAIVRHVEAAIRHYDRADTSNDEDAYTDCIYRTNQVYEGSLKEAYRILSGTSPASKSLFEIEKYFDKDKVVRSRVLVQMQRYRQDYRNPSTHDYKLDFDENEALLSILAVCGFAKLLVSQMKTKIESEIILQTGNFETESALKAASKNINDFAKELAESLFNFLGDKNTNRNFESRETLSVVLAYLERSGLHTVRNVYMELGEAWFEWDVIATDKSGFSVPIEVKTSRGRQSPSITSGRVSQVAEFAKVSSYPFAILIEGCANSDEYELQLLNPTADIMVFRIGRSFND
jgi:hypothetical protein